MPQLFTSTGGPAVLRIYIFTAPALCVQSFLYGCNIISLYHAIRALIIINGKIKARRSINKQMLAMAIVLAVFGTANISVYLDSVMKNNLDVETRSKLWPDSLASYPLTPMLVWHLYRKVHQNLLKSFIQATQILVGDFVLVWSFA
jgi:hypothetical protein